VSSAFRSGLGRRRANRAGRVHLPQRLVVEVVDRDEVPEAGKLRGEIVRLLDSAHVHATEGEIVTALQELFGTYTETPVF
jgi:hypothetical protein